MQTDDSASTTYQHAPPQGGHTLTTEDRRRGGHARAGRIRERKAEAERLAVEKLSTSLDRALAVVAEAMEALDQAGPDHRTRLKAAEQVLDRLLGRPATQANVELAALPEPPMSEGAAALEDWLQSLSVEQLRELAAAEWPPDWPRRP